MIPAATRPCFCGESRARVRFRTNRFGLVACPSCGCYRIDPPPISTEDEAGSFYTDYYANLRGDNANGAAGPTPPAPDLSRRSSRFWRVAERVPALLRAGGSAADIGCGEGRLCAELRQAGWSTVIGVDVSQTRIARARQLYPDIIFHDRPIEEVDVPAGSLDLIVLDNVIEHLVDPLDAVRRLRPLLTPTGLIVLITPNMQSGSFRLLGRRWTPELAPHAHIFLFTHGAMRRMLTSAGFAVEAQGDFHLPVYSMRAWLRRLMGGDVKDIVWHAMQEMGGLYGRLIGAGPMLFAVAHADPGSMPVRP
ncbi:MAG TPA: class I SAM-dependent methyltransferase [Gemmatimonadaceae bacterium]